MPDEQNYNLNPVDYTPTFAEPFAIPQTPVTPEQTARFREGVKTLFKNTMGAPGVVAQPIAPQTPGMWSDEDEARRLATEGRATDWAPQQALNMVGQGATGAVEGAAGIFGGKLAVTADKQALADAMRMTEAGIKREDVWQKTGWFQGADKKWRFEIPDEASRIGNAATEELLGAKGETEGKAAGLLWHDPLYQAYPELRRMDFDARIRVPWEEGPKGSFGGDYYHASGHNLEDIRSTALHELQHGVQAQEQFATGANKMGMSQEAWKIYKERLQAIRDAGKITREEFSAKAGYEGLAPERDFKEYVKSTRKISPMIDRAAQEYAVSEAYKRSAGEVESRNVQSRRNMTPEERRANPPWTTEDVPQEQQLVRFATKPVDYDPFADDAKHAKGGAVKLTHASVGYVAQSTHLPQKCGGCTMFLPPSGCTLVQSPIKAGGWCRRFEGKHAPIE